MLRDERLCHRGAKKQFLSGARDNHLHEEAWHGAVARAALCGNEPARAETGGVLQAAFQPYYRTGTTRRDLAVPPGASPMINNRVYRRR
jgi:hypothetical protein